MEDNTVKLFLDSCVIIYWLEAKQPFYGKFIKKLEKIHHSFSDANIIISRLSVLECLVQPIRENNKELQRLYNNFFSNLDIEIIELDADIINLATQLRAKFYLKTPDAIQAACVLSLNTEVKFITNDSSFNNIPGLQIIGI